MVKKLEKGSTVTCSKCYKKGHKSKKCPQPKKKLLDEKNKKKLTIKSSLIYTKPNRRNKGKSTSYVIKKKTNGKVVAHKVGKQERSWNHSIWVPKDVITNMKGPQMVCGFQRRFEAQEWLQGIWRLSLQDDEKVQAKKAKLTTWTFVAQISHKVMVARFLFKHHVAPLLLLGCLHCIT